MPSTASADSCKLCKCCNKSCCSMTALQTSVQLLLACQHEKVNARAMNTHELLPQLPAVQEVLCKLGHRCRSMCHSCLGSCAEVAGVQPEEQLLCPLHCSSEQGHDRLYGHCFYGIQRTPAESHELAHSTEHQPGHHCCFDHMNNRLAIRFAIDCRHDLSVAVCLIGAHHIGKLSAVAVAAAAMQRLEPQGNHT